MGGQDARNAKYLRRCPLNDFWALDLSVDAAQGVPCPVTQRGEVT